MTSPLSEPLRPRTLRGRGDPDRPLSGLGVLRPAARPPLRGSTASRRPPPVSRPASAAQADAAWRDGSGSLAKAASAPLKSPRRLSASICDASAGGSSPAVSPRSRTWTRPRRWARKRSPIPPSSFGAAAASALGSNGFERRRERAVGRRPVDERLQRREFRRVDAEALQRRRARSRNGAPDGELVAHRLGDDRDGGGIVAGGGLFRRDAGFDLRRGELRLDLVDATTSAERSGAAALGGGVPDFELRHARRRGLEFRPARRPRPRAGP